MALAGGLVVAGALAIVALLLGRQANLNANAAQQERQAALAEADLRATAEAVALERRGQALVQASIGLASQALLELEGTSPERSVLLVLEALEHYPYTWQAERALSQAVLGSRLRLILRHEGMVTLFGGPQTERAFSRPAVTPRPRCGMRTLGKNC
jgi:hypothetical protein